MSNHYLNLMAQVDKLHRHNRQGSYKTRARYYEAMQRFCRFLAEAYRLERLANIAPKHIYAYVAYLQEQGKSASTIKTDLSAIRFFHDLIPNARYELPENGDLLLQRRTFGGVDRTWSDAEFSRMLTCAAKAGREDYIAILHLGRFAGLRIHECFRIDTATAAKAVKEKAITIKGKGGLIRTVPLSERLANYLQFHLEQTRRGHKFFVADDQQTHEAIKQAENRLAAGAAWSNPDDLVFTDGTGKHYAIHNKYFKRIAASIGRPDARPHDLRHTAATVAIASGADVKSVQDMLGHATASFTLNVYAHTSEQMMKDTASRMQGYYDGLKKGQNNL